MLMYNGYTQGYGSRTGYGDFWDDLASTVKTGIGIVNKVINPPATTPQSVPATTPAYQTQAQAGLVSVPFLGSMNATTLMLGIGAIGAAWIFLSKKGRR